MRQGPFLLVPGEVLSPFSDLIQAAAYSTLRIAGRKVILRDRVQISNPPSPPCNTRKHCAFPASNSSEGNRLLCTEAAAVPRISSPYCAIDPHVHEDAAVFQRLPPAMPTPQQCGGNWHEQPYELALGCCCCIGSLASCIDLTNVYSTMLYQRCK